MIDSVSGGALVIRNKKYQKGQIETYKSISLGTQLRDRLYPLCTFLIRNSYSIYFGKLLHHLLKKSGTLSQSMSGNEATILHDLPGWYSKVALGELKNLDANIQHRRTITKVYIDKIDKRIVSKTFENKINLSSNIRFPIFVKNRKSLINYLRTNGLYVSDIWYDAPVAPERYLKFTNYKLGECSSSEKVSKEILNLPTHLNISLNDAKKISGKINEWLNTQ
jgi:hypothetical protein